MPKTGPFCLFVYVGPPEFTEQGFSSDRFRIQSSADLVRWRLLISDLERDGTAASTYVITEDQELWVADRRSEHVSCARGLRVIAAGEVFLNRDGTIDRMTNQSTGYCPSKESWTGVEETLRSLKIACPSGGFDPAFEFRRCTSCDEVQLVKDDFYYCTTCSTELNAEWNVS